MKIDIVTIFPEYFAPLEISLLGKARRAGLLDVNVHDLRAWTHDRHRTVDDTPYGGGPGMVMKPDPWGEALDTLIPPPLTDTTPTPRPDAPVSHGEAAPADAITPPGGTVPTGGAVQHDEPVPPGGPASTDDTTPDERLPSAGGAPSGGIVSPGEAVQHDESAPPGGPASTDDTTPDERLPSAGVAPSGGIVSPGEAVQHDESLPPGGAASVDGTMPGEGIAPAGGVPTGEGAPSDGSVSPGGAASGEVPSAGGGASVGGPMLRGGALPAGGTRFAETMSAAQITPSGGSVSPGGAPTGEVAPTGEDVLPGSGESSSPGAGAVPRLIIPTPSGRPFTQADAVRYAAEPWLVFACGRYEGIDSRVAEEARTRMPVDEVSLGDFVLAGGEVAVMVMIEAIARLVPGVLGNAQSVTDDSFAPGAMESLLEGPVYTKPPVWRERPVPDVLLSGHHGAIARWRRDEAIRRTARHRPELLARLAPEDLDKRDRAVLHEAGFPVDGEGVAD